MTKLQTSGCLCPATDFFSTHCSLLIPCWPPKLKIWLNPAKCWQLFDGAIAVLPGGIALNLALQWLNVGCVQYPVKLRYALT
ncbi:hypothetical protein [Rheinheimera pacifica]|uniref:hypothetical protein n=1 Tax=Rheinheimera pacifica TaxID=173990 RepID=UPI002EDB177A